MRELISLKTGLGHQINAFKDDAITREIERHGVYDRWTLSAIEFLLSEISADTCLDIGANIGNHALSMSAYCQRVIAFEPVPFIHEVLKNNLQANVENAAARAVALSDRQEKNIIRIPSHGNLGQSSMATEFDGAVLVEQIEIQTVVGDDFLIAEFSGINNPGIDFIKIDVEGFESQVVAGLRETIGAHQPIVMLEWNSENTRDGFSQHNLFDTVFKDYHACSLTHLHSKQLSGRGIVGVLKRLKAKTSSNSFCVDVFESQKDYPNVLLIPNRWRSLIINLPKSGRRSMV